MEIEIEEHDGLVLLYRPGDPRVLVGWFIAREGEIVDGVWKEITRWRLVEEAPAMLEALRSIARDDDGDAMLDAAGMDRIEALLDRIGGE